MTGSGRREEAKANGLVHDYIPDREGRFIVYVRVYVRMYISQVGM